MSNESKKPTDMQSAVVPLIFSEKDLRKAYNSKHNSQNNASLKEKHFEGIPTGSSIQVMASRWGCPYEYTWTGDFKESMEARQCAENATLMNVEGPTNEYKKDTARQQKAKIIAMNKLNREVFRLRQEAERRQGQEEAIAHMEEIAQQAIDDMPQDTSDKMDGLVSSIRSYVPKKRAMAKKDTAKATSGKKKHVSPSRDVVVVKEEDKEDDVVSAPRVYEGLNHTPPHEPSGEKEEDKEDDVVCVPLVLDDPFRVPVNPLSRGFNFISTNTKTHDKKDLGDLGGFGKPKPEGETPQNQEAEVRDFGQ